MEITQGDAWVKPWRQMATSRLPGIQPLDLDDWVWVDDAFSEQMAYREHLLTHQRDLVLEEGGAAQFAVDELLSVFVAHLASVRGYDVGSNAVTRPDGVAVLLDQYSPMETIGRLGQQDFCVLQKVGDEHVLQAAVLCFPASWSLAEKIGKPLIAIHKPVENYDDKQAKKVQNLFDLMRQEQALWRANRLIYSDPDLFQPRREDNKRAVEGEKRWLRVERQTLRKLPKTGAIIFGIHSFVVPFERLEQEDIDALLNPS